MNDRRPTTRGPLPPEVYWRRRFFVVALAATLVFLIGSVLSGGGDASSEEAPVARQAAGQASDTITVQPTAKARRGKAGKSQPTGPMVGPTLGQTELAQPEGPCDASDVIVTPQVVDAVAGREVTIGLRLQTTGVAACTWKVSGSSVAVKIQDGTYEVWTSRECPRAVPKESVVVRRAIATVVEMTWNARESAAGCPRGTDWAMPGDFTATAAAYGGEPAETTFEMVLPSAATTTVAPKEPKTSKDAKDSKKSNSRKSDSRKSDSKKSGRDADDDGTKKSGRKGEQTGSEPRR